MHRHWNKIAVAVFVLCLFGSFYSRAATVEELQSGIQTKQSEIAALEKEIAQYQTQLTQTGKQITTLQSTIATITLTQKKLTADISLTKKKIEEATLTIQQLQIQIQGKAQTIGSNQEALQETIRTLAHSDYSPIETALSDSSFSDYWNSAATISQLDKSIDTQINNLREQKKGLETNRDKVAAEKSKLNSLNSDLAAQKKVADQLATEKQQLLSSTKNQEANYKKLLAQKVARRTAVANELTSFESQLKIAIDQSKLPGTGTHALAYPLKKIIVTQYFGDTDFAKSMPQLYNGLGHNGIDLAAPVGTSVLAAQSGFVVGFGNTDLTCNGASYGKWVLLQHANGLSTLYAHLSVISVSVGQQVAQGERIAYSGVTGYSTGPHLHFTVFATQGVAITKLQSKVAGCGVYTVPRGSLNSYLNPLVYL